MKESKEKLFGTLLLFVIIIIAGSILVFYGKNMRENFCKGPASNFLMKKVVIDHKDFGNKGGGLSYFVKYKGEKLSGDIDLRYEDRLSVGDSVYAFFRKDLNPNITYRIKEHPCDTIYWDSVRLIN
jgi:hypothetical protein